MHELTIIYSCIKCVVWSVVLWSCVALPMTMVHLMYGCPTCMLVVCCDFYFLGIACCGLVSSKQQELEARRLALASCLKEKCATCLYLFGASMFTWCTAEDCDGLLNRKHKQCPKCLRPRCEVVLPSKKDRPRSLGKIARGHDPFQGLIREDLRPQDPEEMARWLKGIADYGREK